MCCLSGEYSISVQDVGKRYRLGTMLPVYRRVARQMRHWVMGTPDAEMQARNFWALRNVSFDVSPGEVVGVIGHNGAGKSTLLKLMSGITDPTEGSITMRGRVSSLLEVGTGFHPELSGAENIYLNGAILGMKRREIGKQFDAIVDFAGVEKFLATPVKRYSSGMYVRLAFAVAAHLRPEILIVDEVLAVGDSSFQTKCLGKMRDVAGQGRTVMFVSHNMSAIANLCQRCVMLEGGQLAEVGPTDHIIRRYLKTQGSTEISGEHVYPDDEQPGSEGVRLVSMRVLDDQGQITGTPDRREAFDVQMVYDVDQPTTDLTAGMTVMDHDARLVFVSLSSDPSGKTATTWQPGRHTITCRVPGEMLNANRYSLGAWVGKMNVRALVCVRHVLPIELSNVGEDDTDLFHQRDGAVAPRLDWTHQIVPPVTSSKELRHVA